MHSPTFPILPLSQPGTGSPSIIQWPPKHPTAEARGHRDGHQAQLGPVPPHALTRWVWVSLPLVFYTVLKLYASVGDARGNCQWQMVGKREKDRAHCLWAREHNTPGGSVEGTAKGGQPALKAFNAQGFPAFPTHTHLRARNNPAPDPFFLSFFFLLLLSSPSKTKMFLQMHWSPSNRSLCLVALNYIFFVCIPHPPRLSTGCLIRREILVSSAKTPRNADTEGSLWE